MNAYCNVYFLAIDYTRLTQGDETVSLYASDQHPDLKDQLVKSTFYTGPADRIIPTPEPTPPSE